jgi:hypothetical protein
MGLGSPTQNPVLEGPFQPMNHRQDADATSVPNAPTWLPCPAESEHCDFARDLVWMEILEMVGWGLTPRVTYASMGRRVG